MGRDGGAVGAGRWIGGDCQGWEEPEVLEKDLSLVGAEERSGTGFAKKSRTKHKHIVIQPSQNRARLHPKWRQELCPWWGARGGCSEAHPCLQSCRDASGIQEGVTQPFPDPLAQALLTVMKEGSSPTFSLLEEDRGVPQGISSSPSAVALFAVLPVAS